MCSAEVYAKYHSICNSQKNSPPLAFNVLMLFWSRRTASTQGSVTRSVGTLVWFKYREIVGSRCYKTHDEAETERFRKCAKARTSKWRTINWQSNGRLSISFTLQNVLFANRYIFGFKQSHSLSVEGIWGKCFPDRYCFGNNIWYADFWLPFILENISISSLIVFICRLK